MLENAREWLEKGNWEKCIGFLILFIATYGILWGLVEPLISSDIAEKFFGANALKHWWKYQLCISGLVSFFLFMWLKPDKVLQSFGTEIQDTYLTSGFTMIGNPEISIINDGYYGDVYQLEGNFSVDAFDWNINAIANESTYVSYIYQPKSKFVIYLRISVISKKRNKEEFGWIALKTDISLPKGDKGQKEWAYPVKAKNAKFGWLGSHVRISEAVKKTFGNEGWQYNKLLGIRIRGTGKIQKIILRG